MATIAVTAPGALELSQQRNSRDEPASARNASQNLPSESETESAVSAGIVSAPSVQAELIAARAKKRAEHKADVHAKAEAFKHTADVLFRTKHYKASCPQYLEAIKLWNSNVDYHIALASAYRKTEWYEEAAHSATMALTFQPTNLEARYIRGVARLEQRLIEQAKIDFEIVLEHDPTHLRARAAMTEVRNFVGLAAKDESTTTVTQALDYSFPRYDQNPLEVASVSDSSDCNHVGNGVPCRFYNHEGCTRKAECAFSHAPDEKSVRDDLGKNVCIYHILGSCKFGVAKCVYSHNKTALPSQGWWTSPDQIAKVKAVVEVAEKNARTLRQLDYDRQKQQLKSAKQGRHNGRREKGRKGKDSVKNAGPVQVVADEVPKRPLDGGETTPAPPRVLRAISTDNLRDRFPIIEESPIEPSIGNLKTPNLV